MLISQKKIYNDFSLDKSNDSLQKSIEIYCSWNLLGGRSLDNQMKKEINIKFIRLCEKDNNNINYCHQYQNSELIGLLKLCLLKEIAKYLDKSQIKKLPETISYIMQILSDGKIEEGNTKETIKNVLKKIEGSNIINFSNYVDEIMDKDNMNLVLNLLKRNNISQYVKIMDMRNRL